MAHCQLSDFSFWSRWTGGTLAPAYTKSALSLLHLNNKKEKSELARETLQHAKRPQVLTAHLQTPSEAEATPPPTPVEANIHARNNTVH